MIQAARGTYSVCVYSKTLNIKEISALYIYIPTENIDDDRHVYYLLRNV